MSRVCCFYAIIKRPFASLGTFLLHASPLSRVVNRVLIYLLQTIPNVGFWRYLDFFLKGDPFFADQERCWRHSLLDRLVHPHPIFRCIRCQQYYMTCLGDHVTHYFPFLYPCDPTNSQRHAQKDTSLHPCNPSQDDPRFIYYRFIASPHQTLTMVYCSFFVAHGHRLRSLMRKRGIPYTQWKDFCRLIFPK